MFACPVVNACGAGARPLKITRNRFRPRGHLFLAALFPVGDAISIDVRAGAVWSPLAEGIESGPDTSIPYSAFIPEPQLSFLFGAGVGFGL